jgi:aldose 1-epimerase
VTRAPSGEQYEIAHGDHRATIVEVGGGVREYSVGGRAVLDRIRSTRSATARAARR